MNSDDLHTIEKDGVPLHEQSSKERKDLVIYPMIKSGLDFNYIHSKMSLLEEVIENENLGQLKAVLEEVSRQNKIKLFDLITPDGMTLLHICT
jgi:hypothetical protein